MKRRAGFLPNAREFDGTVRHVAQRHPLADDANPGTKSRPFKTIAAAVARAGQGDRFVIGAGTYREEAALPVAGNGYCPSSIIVFKAAPGTRVFWKGSDLFAPVWEDLGGKVHRAALPERLFDEGVYNPYALSAVLDEPGVVRPCPDPRLPETLGQIFVDGVPLEQMVDVDAVRRTPGSFAVSADGRHVVVRFKGGGPRGTVELTVRRRCLAPPGDGIFFVETMGIFIGHAAEPGAFERGRPLVIRANPGTGVAVRRTFNVACIGDTLCSAVGQPAYTGSEKNVMRAAVTDDTDPAAYPGGRTFVAESRDGGRRWRPARPAEADPESPGGYFLDGERNVLMRFFNRTARGSPPRHDVMVQYSGDAAATWSAPERVDGGIHCGRPVGLRGGGLAWPYHGSGPDGRLRGGVLVGRARRGGNGVDWERGAPLELPAEQCSMGLCEPAVGELADGRLLVVARQQYPVLASQDAPGFPSVKFFAVSPDGGRTWGPPRPLACEDGRYVYSPASMPGVIVSAKTRRVYVLLNIADGPTTFCDPRTALHLAEFDSERLCLVRRTTAVVEAKHDEHHHRVRFSNFHLVEERSTGRWLLFMRMHMSENCPIRRGYDMHSYRYEIGLPGE